MRTEFTLFLTTFTTLLAIINPLEALPVLLELLEGKDNARHRSVAHVRSGSDRNDPRDDLCP
jgi:multiple antibiotic resistance protein